jgi:hypothetical protein
MHADGLCRFVALCEATEEELAMRKLCSGVLLVGLLAAPLLTLSTSNAAAWDYGYRHHRYHHYYHPYRHHRNYYYHHRRWY